VAAVKRRIAPTATTTHREHVRDVIVVSYRVLAKRDSGSLLESCPVTGTLLRAGAKRPNMRVRTGLVLVGLVALLGGFVVFAVGFSTAGGTLTEQWVSDTARDNEVNHHAVGVGPDGTVVAPVAEVPNSGVPITNTSCSLVRLAANTGSVLWRDGVPAEHCFTHALTEPAIDDVDGDGTFEVVAATTENALVILDAGSGREEFRVPLESYGYARPTLADFRPTPGTELVASDIGGNVVVTAANGTVLWRASLNRTFDGYVSVWEAPIVEDVDDDGSPEVVIGSGSGSAVLSADGEVEWSSEHGATYIATGQADDDPAREIATAEGNVVRVVDGATHSLQWQRTLEEYARLRTLADADNDGAAELYLGLANGTVLAVDAETGATEWTTTVSTDEGSVLASPVLANVDGSGDSEVVVASRTGTVVVLDPASGAELAAYERPVAIYTFPTSGDIDGDDDAEILVRYGDGRVVALNYTS
jgi:outer membrane protein assembly factor BamB